MNPSGLPDLSKLEFQFHDSEVSCVRVVSGDVHIAFSAASVRLGYLKAVEFCLSQASWSGNLNECVGGLSDGELKVDGASIQWVSLPFQGAGNISLMLEFANGALLCVTSTEVRVTQRGHPKFVENFAC